MINYRHEYITLFSCFSVLTLNPSLIYDSACNWLGCHACLHYSVTFHRCLAAVTSLHYPSISMVLMLVKILLPHQSFLCSYRDWRIVFSSDLFSSKTNQLHEMTLKHLQKLLLSLCRRVFFVQ